MVCLKLAKAFNLLDFAYAHRGLWTKSRIPENSIEAYLAAANAGLGLEFDVRPSKDGDPVCIHDPTLQRTTIEAGNVEDISTADLKRVKLSNGECIPTLADLLAVWPKDLPLLVEMKIDGATDPAGFSKRVAKDIDAYDGLAAMMSFNETTVDNIPSSIMRGQLLVPIFKSSEDAHAIAVKSAIERGVDYLGVHVPDLSTMSRSIQLPIVCWTVRTEEEREMIQSKGHAEIYEHLPIPARP